MSEQIPQARSVDEAFRQMTPDMQRLAVDFEQQLATEKRSGLLIRREMGLRIDQVINGESTYGTAAVEQLAVYLSVSPDRLYKLRTFSQTVTHEQLEQWSDRKMTSGGRIAYNHLATIMVVRPVAQRLELVERTFQQSLSVRDVRAIIDAAGCGRRKTGTGTPRSPSVLAGLRQIIKRSNGFLKDLAQWQTVVFDAIDAKAESELEPAVGALMVEAHSVLVELATGVQASINRLSKNLS
jgi:hypothetical protein